MYVYSKFTNVEEKMPIEFYWGEFVYASEDIDNGWKGPRYFASSMSRLCHLAASVFQYLSIKVIT